METFTYQYYRTVMLKFTTHVASEWRQIGISGVSYPCIRPYLTSFWERGWIFQRDKAIILISIYSYGSTTLSMRNLVSSWRKTRVTIVVFDRCSSGIPHGRLSVTLFTEWSWLDFYTALVQWKSKLWPLESYLKSQIICFTQNTDIFLRRDTRQFDSFFVDTAITSNIVTNIMTLNWGSGYRNKVWKSD